MGKQVKDGIVKQDASEALIGLHALTRCDTVPEFASKGEWRPVQMLMKNHTHVNTMTNIGKQWNLSDATFKATEGFLFQLFGKTCTSVDALRYDLHCTKGGRIEPEALHHASHR